MLNSEYTYNQQVTVPDLFNLNRFLEAQEHVFPTALSELKDGHKRSHWMWYIFPQLKFLGHSYKSKFYGISGVDEALSYLENPILGQRLREVSITILNLLTNNATDVFGDIDSCKLHSSMTLFDMVSPNDIFARVLDKYFNGQRDCRTINIVQQKI